jgi:transcriptional regulator with XRE-family HTH domain
MAKTELSIKISEQLKKLMHPSQKVYCEYMASKVGVTYESFRNYYYGACKIRHDILKKIASCYGITVDEFMIGKADKNFFAISTSGERKHDNNHIPWAQKLIGEGYLESEETDGYSVKEINFPVKESGSGKWVQR